jgi:hypothetical protein
LPAARRSLLGWTLAFTLSAALPLVDKNGGDLDGFANAGTFVLLALGLNIVVGFADCSTSGMRRSSPSGRTRTDWRLRFS